MPKRKKFINPGRPKKLFTDRHLDRIPEDSSVQEVAYALLVDPQTVRSWVIKNKLASIVGGKYRIRRQNFIKWVKKSGRYLFVSEY